MIRRCSVAGRLHHPAILGGRPRGDKVAALRSCAPSTGLAGLIRRCSVAERLHRPAILGGRPRGESRRATKLRPANGASRINPALFRSRATSSPGDPGWPTARRKSPRYEAAPRQRG
ncbi:MAG: hypothetical protein E3J21_19070 [Anaerolineales bacterium]|nr:MAG: hypothetical protein E3J21_19070 [Anaerolineales bacterium]